MRSVRSEEFHKRLTPIGRISKFAEWPNSSMAQLAPALKAHLSSSNTRVMLALTYPAVLRGLVGIL